MKKILLLLIPVVLFGCTTPENKVIAKVEKHKITQGEFDFEVARLKKAMVPEDYVMSDEEKLMFEQQILNNLIMKSVYTKRLDDLDIQVDDATIDDQFKKLTAQYGSEEAMTEDVISKGFTMDELKEEFIYQFRLQELSKIASESDTVVSDLEIQTYYDENKDTVFTQPAVVNSARHILIQIDEAAPEKALEEIKSIREKIINGMDFAQAAIEFSQGPSAPNGGDLGQFQQGQMVPEFEAVAFTVPVNQVSEPVLTEYGYHLILVESRSEPSSAPFEDTVEYITSKLKVQKYFEDIESSVKITKPEWAETKI